MLLARLAGGDKTVVPSSRRIIVPTLAITHGTVQAYLRHQAVLLRGS